MIATNLFVLIVVSRPNSCSGLYTIVDLLYKFVHYAQIKYFHCHCHSQCDAPGRGVWSERLNAMLQGGEYGQTLSM